jgi:mRNA-degrading endonuclease RelE of RelBE toxin-antitoxin system
MAYTIEISPRAFRDLGGLEKRAAKAVLDELEMLKATPWPTPPQVKKLAGFKTLYRLRTGNYRTIFEALGRNIVVLRVMDRKEMERALKNL